MRLKRLLGLVTLLLMSMAALAQINIYLGLFVGTANDQIIFFLMRNLQRCARIFE